MCKNPNASLERAKRELFPVKIWRIRHQNNTYDVMARSFNEAYEELLKRLNKNNK